jgi:hypothetical protein
MNTDSTTGAGLTVAGIIHFARRGKTKELRNGAKPVAPALGRVPRVARLMALALKFDGLIHEGAVADQAELARLGHVTRARVSQIMNLLHLAPDIQEAILFLPAVERGAIRWFCATSSRLRWSPTGASSGRRGPRFREYTRQQI